MPFKASPLPVLFPLLLVTGVVKVVGRSAGSCKCRELPSITLIEDDSRMRPEPSILRRSKLGILVQLLSTAAIGIMAQHEIVMSSEGFVSPSDSPIKGAISARVTLVIIWMRLSTRRDRASCSPFGRPEGLLFWKCCAEW